jgi:hypothetical protein
VAKKRDDPKKEVLIVVRHDSDGHAYMIGTVYWYIRGGKVCYIGQTYRDLAVRKQEHRDAARQVGEGGKGTRFHRRLAGTSVRGWTVKSTQKIFRCAREGGTLERRQQAMAEDCFQYMDALEVRAG